jgi:hypothetical protein
MQVHNITTLAQFDQIVAEEQQHIDKSHQQFEALGLNYNFTSPDWEPAKARRLFSAALAARGEYRRYLLDKCNEALYCNANDAHISGPMVNIKE